LEDPCAVAFLIVVVGVAGKYHDTLPRGLPYLRKAGAPIMLRLEEFRITIFGYFMEEKLPGVFIKSK